MCDDLPIWVFAYISQCFRRFDYLLISHFLLNLQDISTITFNGSDPSNRTFGRTGQYQVSSIRFAHTIIGNLGASLRDEALEDNDDDNDVVKGVETLSSPGYGEEVHAVVKLLPTDVKKENVVGCSTISAAESENCAWMLWAPSRHFLGRLVNTVPAFVLELISCCVLVITRATCWKSLETTSDSALHCSWSENGLLTS